MSNVAHVAIDRADVAHRLRRSCCPSGSAAARHRHSASSRRAPRPVAVPLPGPLLPSRRPSSTDFYR